MMHQSVLAIAAHPDDIEFVMAGTLLRLVECGWEAHYLNVANGCCGSTQLSREPCAAKRLQEAQRAAELLPAKFYPPLCADLEVFYGKQLLAQVAAIVRQSRPSIVLTHAPVDYMEDHQNAARLAVTAAFARGTPNFETHPPVESFQADVAVYHAQPHGNRDPLGQIVRPSHYVDVTDLIPKKRELLGCHESQAQWLDETQAMGSYLQTMENLNAEVGSFSGCFTYAEGWRQHLHLGFSAEGFDPLRDVLGNKCVLQVDAKGR